MKQENQSQSKKAFYESLAIHGAGILFLSGLFYCSDFSVKKEPTIIEIAGIVGDLPAEQQPPEELSQEIPHKEPEEVKEELKEELIKTENKNEEEASENSRLKYEAQQKEKRLADEKKKREIEIKKREEIKKRQEIEKKKREEAEKKRQEMRKKKENDLKSRLKQGKEVKTTSTKRRTTSTSSNKGSNIAERISGINTGGGTGTQGTGTQGTGSGKYTTLSYKSLLHDCCQRYWKENRPSRAELNGKTPTTTIRIVVNKNGIISQVIFVKKSGLSAVDSRVQYVISKLKEEKLPPFSQYNIPGSSINFEVNLEIQ